MSVWFQQIEPSLVINPMALTHNLNTGALELENHLTREHYYRHLFNKQTPAIQRPDSSCSLNSNSSIGREVATDPPIHNRNFQESRYKTELCRHYEERGECPHGLQCLFAHGQGELLPFRGRHRKFKTQLCKAFHSEGFCSFGPRCSYIHSKPSPEALTTPKTDIQGVREFTMNLYSMPSKQDNGCRLSVFTQICKPS